MARRKKQDATPMLIFYGLIILIAIFTVMATLVIWIGWLSCEILYAKHPKSPEATDIELSENEINEMKQLERFIYTTEERLEDIDVEGESLRRRKDGLFHAGSSLGAKLNSEKIALFHNLENSKIIRNEISARPSQRLHEWCKPLSRLIAFRWAICTHIVCTLISVINKPSLALFLHQWFENVLGNYLPSAQPPIYGAIAIASTVASIVLAIGLGVYNKKIFNSQKAKYRI